MQRLTVDRINVMLKNGEVRDDESTRIVLWNDFTAKSKRCRSAVLIVKKSYLGKSHGTGVVTKPVIGLRESV